MEATRIAQVHGYSGLESEYDDLSQVLMKAGKAVVDTNVASLTGTVGRCLLRLITECHDADSYQGAASALICSRELTAQ